MNMILPRAGIFLFLLLSLLADGPVSAEPTSSLKAGLAATDVTPPIGMPLGGFGSSKRRLGFPWDITNKYPYTFLFEPSTGILDPIRAKALVLENNYRKLVFLSLDLVGVTEEAVNDITEALGKRGFKKDELMISATHTHSGPGGLSNNFLWEVVAMDFFQKQVYKSFVQKIVDTVTRAYEQRTDAELFEASFEAQDLQRNRRGHEGLFDPQANVLFVKQVMGPWLGAVANLAIHGTALDSSNLLYSADVPGGIERGLQKRLAGVNQSIFQPAPPAGKGKGPIDPPPARELPEPVVVFINGAEGDVAPKYGNLEGITKTGESFADQAMNALGRSRQIDPVWETRRTEVFIGGASLDVSVCTEKSAFQIPGYAPIALWLPDTVPVMTVKLGDSMMVTWPGEPTTLVGRAVKQITQEAGAKQTWILGLTNGYTAYYTTPEEFHEASYESCSSLYGDTGAKTIVDAIRAMLLTKAP